MEGVCREGKGCFSGQRAMGRAHDAFWEFTFQQPKPRAGEEVGGFQQGLGNDG